MRNCVHKLFARKYLINELHNKQDKLTWNTLVVTWECFTFTLCLLSLSTLLIIELIGLWFRTLHRPACGMMWRTHSGLKTTETASQDFCRKFSFLVATRLSLMSVVFGTKSCYDIEFKISWLTELLLARISGVLAWTGELVGWTSGLLSSRCEMFSFRGRNVLRKNFVLCLCREPGVQHKRTERIIKMYNLRLYVIHFSRLKNRVARWSALQRVCVILRCRCDKQSTPIPIAPLPHRPWTWISSSGNFVRWRSLRTAGCFPHISATIYTTWAARNRSHVCGGVQSQLVLNFIN